MTGQDGTAQAREAAAARFDALLAQNPLPDAATLRAEMRLELDGLSKHDHHSLRTNGVHIARLALLAGATRDHELWLRLVRHLTTEDAVHRLHQKMSGVDKDDLGPPASDKRSAGWVRREAKRVKVPAAAWLRIDAVLEEYETAFPGRPASVESGSPG